MLETKDQKQIFYGSIALIVILVVVSIWHKPINQPSVDYAALEKQSELKQQAYVKFLASLGTTPQAQKQLFDEILPPEEMRKAVEDELEANQPIVIPDKPKTKITTVNETGQDVMIAYADAATPIVEKVSSVTILGQNELLRTDGNMSSINKLITSLEDSLKQYSNLKVPQEAVDFQSQQLIALEAYLDMAKLSKNYINEQENKPWPKMYKNAAIMAETTVRAQNAFSALDAKYGFSKQNGEKGKTGWFVPTAHAFVFAFVIDIFQKIQYIAESIAIAALATFEIHFLNKLSQKIQKAYAITNYLYYADALVSGQYVDDYLNKYVKDATDRALVRQFIPAVSCGTRQNFSSVFKTKAKVHLGFDPNTVDPKDPNYYQKSAKIGDFFSSPNGWQLYYQDVAAQAENVAKQSADRELTGAAKTSRGLAGEIITSAQDVLTTQKSSLQAMINSGYPGETGNPWAAKIASHATQVFINSFVFKGAVLKEQRACLPTPVVSLVTTVPKGAAPNPVAPTEQAIIAESCSSGSDLSDDCTPSIIAELKICADNPSQHTGTQPCYNLAASNYVNTFLGKCSGPPVGRPNFQQCAEMRTAVDKIPKTPPATVVKYENGESCQKNEDCFSNVCGGEVCLGNRGDGCTAPEECAPGLGCGIDPEDVKQEKTICR